MRNTKVVLTGFAVFAAILILMATCIAGPVEEKTSLDAADETQQRLIRSVEAMSVKIENDEYLNNMIEQISNDLTLTNIKDSIKDTEDNGEKISLTADYINVLTNKEEIANLKEYFQSTYSKDMENINNELSSLIDQLIADQNTESGEPEIQGYLPLNGAQYTVDGDVQELLSGCSVSLGSPDFMLTDSGGIIILNDMDDVTPAGDGDENNVDSGEAQWAGFLRNMNGDILTPDGWISPDDPDYDDWLEIEQALLSAGIGLGGILFILWLIVVLIDVIIIAIQYLITVIIEVLIGVVESIVDWIEENLDAIMSIIELVVYIVLYPFVLLRDLIDQIIG